MASPSPSPLRRSRSGLCSCTNSWNIDGSRSAGMPRPVSHTPIFSESPDLRQPTSTPPSSLWRMALEIRLMRMRLSSSGSLHRWLLHGRTLNRRPFSAASGANWLSSSSSRCCKGKCTGLASMTPASSREMSSNALNSSSIEAVASSIWPTRSATSGCRLRAFNADTNSDSACIGWRRSWLAAAKNRDFAALARSTESIRAANSVAASLPRTCLSAWYACRAEAISLIPVASAPNSLSFRGRARTAKSPCSSRLTAWRSSSTATASCRLRRQARMPLIAKPAPTSRPACSHHWLEPDTWREK
jgi:hypothetical protein